jgi:hypothetical protein
MKSVLDALRRDALQEALRLTPAERIERALALGDADAAVLAAYRGISEREARRTLEQARHRGRCFSASHESLLR